MEKGRTCHVEAGGGGKIPHRENQSEAAQHAPHEPMLRHTAQCIENLAMKRNTASNSTEINLRLAVLSAIAKDGRRYTNHEIADRLIAKLGRTAMDKVRVKLIKL